MEKYKFKLNIQIFKPEKDLSLRPTRLSCPAPNQPTPPPNPKPITTTAPKTSLILIPHRSFSWISWIIEIAGFGNTTNAFGHCNGFVSPSPEPASLNWRELEARRRRSSSSSCGNSASDHRSGCRLRQAFTASIPIDQAISILSPAVFWVRIPALFYVCCCKYGDGAAVARMQPTYHSHGQNLLIQQTVIQAVSVNVTKYEIHSYVWDIFRDEYSVKDFRGFREISLGMQFTDCSSSLLNQTLNPIRRFIQVCRQNNVSKLIQGGSRPLLFSGIRPKNYILNFGIQTICINLSTMPWPQQLISQHMSLK